MDEFKRFELLIGSNNLNKLNCSHVLVLGCGGVGSYVIESLIRSGVGSITIVDYDLIDITNLNRQLMTNLNNIGLLKVDVLEKRATSINENIRINKISEFIDESNYEMLFNNSIDYFIDCCDTVNTKKIIIKECINRNIPFITCCGTGKRLDPSMLCITDIKKTSYDPIARILRKFLKDERINGKVMCCFSKEEPVKISGNIIASSAFVPSSAGILIASYVVRDILKLNFKDKIKR